MEIPTSYQSVFKINEEIPQEPFPGPFFFDLETLPDFQRKDLFGLPEITPYKAVDPVQAIPDILDLAVDTIRNLLKKHQPTEGWLHKMRTIEESGKKRKTVFQEIDKAIERMGWAAEEEAAQNKKMGTTPEMCMIISMGFACGSADDIHSMTVGDVLDDGSGEDEKVVNEWNILEAFWSMAKKCRGPLCGYNINGFDIPVILTRSIILGIPATRQFDTKPWGKDLCDLMLKRWPRGQAGKLKELAPLYGIEIPAEGVDGGSVLPLWEEDRLDLINEYVKSDVQVTRDLYNLFEGYYI